MPNEYYSHSSGVPGTGATGSSSVVRTELDDIAKGFDKLPALTGNANEIVAVNAGETGLTSLTTAAALTLIGAQPLDQQLTDIAALTPTDSTFIVGNGTTFVSENATTARASLGLDSMATQAAGAVAITGGTITGGTITGGTITGGTITGITDLTIADGGTGASTAANARTNILETGSVGKYLRSDGSDAVWSPPIAGAMFYIAADGASTNLDDEYISFVTSVYETVECVSAVAPAGGTTSLITVPSGYAWMKVISLLKFQANATGVRGVKVVSTNSAGSTATLLAPDAMVVVGSNSGSIPTRVEVDTGWRQVTAGAYYKIVSYQNSGGNLDLLADGWFSVEFK